MPSAYSLMPGTDAALALGLMHELIVDHVPPYQSAEGDPGLAARYPSAMILALARHILNSTFVTVESLRDIEGEPLLEIHPSDAGERGIFDGSQCRTHNDRGEYVYKAAVSARARASWSDSGSGGESWGGEETTPAKSRTSA